MFLGSTGYPLGGIIGRGSTSLRIKRRNRRGEYVDLGCVFRIGEIAFEDTAKNLLENEEIRRAFLREC